MKISACYIVKNEAKVLERSLQSIVGGEGIEEIVVVDTGSVDDTVAIARRFGARVFSFAWREDFAAARNFALSKASGDWVLFLDADEYFSPPLGKNLFAALVRAAEEGKDAAAIRMVHIEPLTEEVLGEVFALRAFLRKEMVYEGRIHEAIVRKDGEATSVAFLNGGELTLLHTGYQAEVSEEKARRNLRLLLRELEERQDASSLYPYLAETYDALDDGENAVYYAELDVQRGRQPVSYASRSYRILLRRLSDRERRLFFAEKAAQEFPELSEFAAEYAECLAADWQVEKAVSVMDSALLPKAFNPLELSFFTEDLQEVARARQKGWQDLLRRAEELSVSACVIARNDRKDLPRWLENIEVFADERIYVDTGSEDGSREFMEAAGVKPYAFSWCDDFAAARNFALEQATGDWVVFLDADEGFYRPEIVRLVLAAEGAREVFEVPIVNVDEDDGGREIQRFRAVRIFRRRKDLRYAGRIHEALKKDGAPPETGYLAALSVRHTGYSSGRIRKKLKRNLAILERGGEVQPETARYFADCYFGLGRYAEAAACAERAIASSWVSAGSDSDLFYTAAAAYRRLGDVSSEERVLSAAVDRFADLPDFWGLYGLFLERQGRDFPLQEACFSRAIRLFDTGGEERALTATRFVSFGDRVFTAYGKALLKAGEKAAAKGMAERALRLNPEFREAVSVYADSLPPMTVRERAAKVGALFPETAAGRRSLLIWASEKEEWALREEYTKELQEKFGIEDGDSLAYLYDLHREGDLQGLYDGVVKELAARIPEFFALLLEIALSEDGREQAFLQEARGLLPQDAAEVFACYLGERSLGSVEFDTYLAFLPKVANAASPAAKERYAAIAGSLSGAEIVRAAEAFRREEDWQTAFSLYGLLAADDQAVDGAFWHGAGVCLYHLGEREAAKESLLRAAQQGTDLPEGRSYLAWIEEGEGNR